MRLSVIIPCFNEAETIEAVVMRVLSVELPGKWDKEVIVVDDGSGEPTKRALARIEEAGHPVQIVYRERNGGKGAAVKDGMRSAQGDYVIIQDADLEYSPEEYGSLIAPLTADSGVSVFGTRKNTMNNVPYSRIYFYGGLLVTHIYNFMFQTKLSDIASCYKLFSVEHVPALLLSSHDDFVFDAVDLTHTLVKAGPIVEVPITYTARSKKTGKKLNWMHGLDIVMAIMLTRLGVPSEKRSSVARVLRFIISGGIAAVANIILLYVLTDLVGIWYIISSAIAFVAAFLISFLLQKFWAFRNKRLEDSHVQMSWHLTTAVINLGLNLAIIYTLVEFVGFHYIPGQLAASIIIAFESFFMFRWIYR